MKDSFNKTRDDRIRLLFKAVETGDSVRLYGLLEKGVDVNAVVPPRGLLSKAMYKTPYAPGSTALHVAALAGDLHCAYVLMDFKADLNAVNEEAQTPLDYALTNLRHYEDKAAGYAKSQFALKKWVAETEDKVTTYRLLIQALLRRGARPGLFKVPAEFVVKQAPKNK